MKDLESLLSKEEVRRLEKAAREKNKEKLIDWAKQFEYQLSQQYEIEYEKQFKKDLIETLDNFILTIVYTLHFNETTKFGKKRIKDFMDDLLETVDMFRRGEAVPDDYREQLKEEGILVKKSEE